VAQVRIELTVADFQSAALPLSYCAITLKNPGYGNILDIVVTLCE
jgi:hypothetical protein